MLRWQQGELSREQVMRLEWLETNGLGGYACGTILGVRTRRYHGLLVAALNPPTRRTLLWAGTDEMVACGDKTWALSAHLFRNGLLLAPENAPLQLPSEFALDWCPQWRYDLPCAHIVKRLFMPSMKNAVALRYFVFTVTPVTLRVRIFVAWRDHHFTQQSVMPFAVRIYEGRGQGKGHGQGFAMFADEAAIKPFCHFAHNGDAFLLANEWWHNFWLPMETERGLDDTESLFCAGTIVKRVEGEGRLDIVASVEPCEVWEVPEWEARERKRKRQWIAKGEEDWAAELFRASEAFIALRSSTGTRTVIAGYPWFTDWGRDALIALPGLTLVTGRFAVAREILLTFARYLSQGMVPNFFPESGDPPVYNTVDATLWFVLAVYRYLRYTRDWETARRSLWQPLREVLHWHLRGTRFGIGTDPDDGLLSWGELAPCSTSPAPSEALTWMDAKVFGVPVTPRIGKPVEVNALWCNGLLLFERMATHLNDRSTARLASWWARKAVQHFEATFWNPKRGCLFDAITPDGTPDASVRCNQLLALALPFRLLSVEGELQVLRCVEKELLTPCGLRTLSPSDPRYVGRSEGPPHQRDAAYHQGTVWAWWFGPYADAVALIEGERAVQRKVMPLLRSFLQHHLREACIGQVSEIFDGDPPHTPRGCFAQAWSVAEVLRAWQERVRKRLPPPLWDER